MPVVTCPSCGSKYDPGQDDLIASADPAEMSVKVVCPACGQWLRLPENEPIDPPRVPAHVLAAMRAQSRLVERGPGAPDGPPEAAREAAPDPPPRKPWWRFW